MGTSIEQEVRELAGGRCEYCRLPEKFSKLKFVLDHVIASQHGGDYAVGNLALACGFCNRHKGPNIAGIDPATGRISRLYHPRQDQWNRNFRYEQAILIGITPIGRATVAVLAVNHPEQVSVRQTLIDESQF